MVRLRLHIFCIITLFIVSSCASAQPKGNTESSLKERVTAYWQHKIKREFEKSYLFESPEIREKINLTDYIKVFSGPGVWKKATISSVAIEGSFATVHVEINYIIVGVYCPEEGLTSTIREYWQLEDGIWYHLSKHLIKAKNKVKKV